MTLIYYTKLTMRMGQKLIKKFKSFELMWLSILCIEYRILTNYIVIESRVRETVKQKIVS